MTQEEKQLLIKDLCVRLPYGVNCVFHSKKGDIPATLVALDYERGIIYIRPIKQSVVYCYFVEDDNIPNPYLRPMSSMTEEEENEYYALEELSRKEPNHGIDILDWLNAHYLDYRYLIDKGLAFIAPKDMYKI